MPSTAEFQRRIATLEAKISKQETLLNTVSTSQKSTQSQLTSSLTGGNLTVKWQNVRGMAKAQDNATVGATVGENLNGASGELLSITGDEFTMDAANSITITDSNVSADSIILFSPTNADAATLMGSALSLYEDKLSRSAGTSFTVKTASGASASGAENFQYIIINN
jgi:uncharacterized coiled-coil protein SlyX